MQEQLIVVDNHFALVLALGSQEVKSAWWMRARSGVQGLEAVKPDGGMVRIELSEPADSDVVETR